MWRVWGRALEDVLSDAQRSDGAFDGSWDPDGPWGYAGGRVYSTALSALCLEVRFRYSPLFGAR